MDAIPVSPLPPIGGRDWDALRRAFRGRPVFELGQPWRAEPEPLFAAGQARVALSGMSLAIFATLRDRDVFNPVEHFNVPAFPHGDVIEVFLQPEGQAAYYEFHVTPGGALLQLRWAARCARSRSTGRGWPIRCCPIKSRAGGRARGRGPRGRAGRRISKFRCGMSSRRARHGMAAVCA